MDCGCFEMRWSISSSAAIRVESHDPMIPPFSSAETATCQRLNALALAEDLGAKGVGGDVTSQALIPPELQGRAVFVARTAGILAGMPAVRLVLDRKSTRLNSSHLG